MDDEFETANEASGLPARRELRPPRRAWAVSGSCNNRETWPAVSSGFLSFECFDQGFELDFERLVVGGYPRDLAIDLEARCRRRSGRL